MAGGRHLKLSMVLLVSLSLFSSIFNLRWDFRVPNVPGHRNAIISGAPGQDPTRNNPLLSKFTLTSRGHVDFMPFKVKRYFGLRVSRYSDSIFQLSRLIISGDICPNPGPLTKPSCQKCLRTIAINHRSLTCSNWGCAYHMKCGNGKPSDFICIKEKTISWICPQCTWQAAAFSASSPESQPSDVFSSIDNCLLDQPENRPHQC